MSCAKLKSFPSGQYAKNSWLIKDWANELRWVNDWSTKWSLKFEWLLDQFIDRLYWSVASTEWLINRPDQLIDSLAD